MSKDIDCPYCGHAQNINHDDGTGYTEDELHEQECVECTKIFVFHTSVIYHYQGFQADCLNGSPHIYKPTMTTPRCAIRMACETCDECRLPTEAERKTHNIPSYAEYLEELHGPITG